MRKMSLVVAAVLCGCALLVWGCDGDQGEGGSTTGSLEGPPAGGSSSSATTRVGPTPSGPGETTGTTRIVLGDYALWEQTMKAPADDTTLAVTVYKPEDTADAEGMATPEESKLVAVFVRLANSGASGVEVAHTWFQLADADGVLYPPLEIERTDLPLLDQGDLDEGAENAGYLFFELPDKAAVNSVRCDTSHGADPAAVRTWSE